MPLDKKRLVKKFMLKVKISSAKRKNVWTLKIERCGFVYKVIALNEF